MLCLRFSKFKINPFLCWRNSVVYTPKSSHYPLQLIHYNVMNMDASNSGCLKYYRNMYCALVYLFLLFVALRLDTSWLNSSQHLLRIYKFGKKIDFLNRKWASSSSSAFGRALLVELSSWRTSCAFSLAHLGNHGPFGRRCAAWTWNAVRDG